MDKGWACVLGQVPGIDHCVQFLVIYFCFISAFLSTEKEDKKKTLEVLAFMCN
jgi:hypothetical protein